MVRFTMQLNAFIPASGYSKYDFQVPFKVSDLIPVEYTNSRFKLSCTAVIPGATDDIAEDCVALYVTNLSTPYKTGTNKLVDITGGTPYPNIQIPGTDASLVLGYMKPIQSGALNMLRIDDVDSIHHTIRYPTVDTLVFRVMSIAPIPCPIGIGATLAIVLSFTPIA
jgi:hypothetical protein